MSTDDYMPMAINSVAEFEKVLNISWYTHDQPIAQLSYVLFILRLIELTKFHKVPLRPPFLANVPALLHRYSEFLEPVLFLFR